MSKELHITKHAMERLADRRGVKHMIRHIHKINSWGLPPNGRTEHKGWRYVTQGGALVTVLPRTREYKRKMIEEGRHE